MSTKKHVKMEDTTLPDRWVFLETKRGSGDGNEQYDRYWSKIIKQRIVCLRSRKQVNNFVELLKTSDNDKVTALIKLPVFKNIFK